MNEREQERAEIVAWLRAQITENLIVYANNGVVNADQAIGSLLAMQNLADAIEHGDHTE